MAIVLRKLPHGVVCVVLVVLSAHNNNISKQFKNRCGKRAEDIDKSDNHKGKVKGKDLIPTHPVDQHCCTSQPELPVMLKIILR
jgi:hypothetical protein